MNEKIMASQRKFFKRVVKITFWLSRGTQRDSKFKRKDNLIATFCVLSKFFRTNAENQLHAFFETAFYMSKRTALWKHVRKKKTLFLTLQKLSEGFQFWQKNTFHQVSHFWTLRVRRTFWEKTPSWKRITFCNIWTSREQIAAKFFWKYCRSWILHVQRSTSIEKFSLDKN